MKAIRFNYIITGLYRILVIPYWVSSVTGHSESQISRTILQRSHGQRRVADSDDEFAMTIRKGLRLKPRLVIER